MDALSSETFIYTVFGDLKKTVLFPDEVKDETVTAVYGMNTSIKYSSYDERKTGRWIFYSKRNEIKETWMKILEGIANGYILQAKTFPGTAILYDEYPIMVYTKDYTDKEDIRKTLAYLLKIGLVKKE